MKRLLTILCLVLLVSCSQEPPLLIIRDGTTYDQNTNEPVTGIVETFHENGQLEVRGNFIDGKPEGFHEEFHENGQLSFRGNWKDGVQDGLREEFDEDGNLIGTETWENGLLIITGVEIVERDGLIYHQDTNELITGIVEEFHENGQLEFRGTVIDGKPVDGLWELFDEDGNLTETMTFRNGELVEENFNP